jgi:hypothetical protein
MTGQIYNWLPLIITLIVAVIVFVVHCFLHYKDHSKTDKHCEALIELVLLNELWGGFHKKELPFLKPNQIAEFFYELEEIFYKSALRQR